MSAGAVEGLPTAPPPGTRAHRTYQRLLDAMEELLRRGGYPAATSTAVAATAGLSVGTFYRYFADREAALAALFAARLDALIDAVAARLTTDALLDDGLGHVLSAVLDTVVDTYAAHAPTFRTALVQLPSSPQLRAVYWSRHARATELGARFLRRAQAAGKVRAGDPEVLADALLILLQATNTPVLLHDPDRPRTAAVRRELARALECLLSPTVGDPAP